MYPENLQPRLRIGDANLDFAIEAPRPPQRRIEHLRDIRGAHHDHLAARHESVHQAQQLRDHPLFDVARHFRALRRDRVDFVDEQNRRRAPCRFLEHLSELRLALPVELPHDLGAVQVDEVDAALGRDRAGQQRLAGSGRAVEQHALRRENPQLLEEPRVLERQLHDFAHARDLALETANVLV